MKNHPDLFPLDGARNREDQNDRKFIIALARGLEVLRAFRPSDGFLGNQEVADRTGIPKSSITRLTYTLTKLGYLSYSERLEKYQLGSGVLALGYAFLSSLAVRQLAKPLLQELANNTGTAVGLADRDRLEMIYVEYCTPVKATTFRHAVGDRVSLANSATGRAYLAGLSDEERDYFMHAMQRKTTVGWSDLEKGLRRAIKEHQAKGYCSSFGEWNRDVNSIAVPLITHSGNIYSFNASGPAYRLSPEFLENEVAPQLKNLVRNVEATLINY